jgi:hypothetical protein
MSDSRGRLEHQNMRILSPATVRFTLSEIDFVVLPSPTNKITATFFGAK